MVIGIVATSVWQQEKITAMKPGDITNIAGYEITFKGVTAAPGPNFEEQVAGFEVKHDGKFLQILHPSKRQYTVEKQTTTEAGILTSLSGNLYIVLGDDQGTDSFSVRLYFHPLVQFIWTGAIIMFFGGLFSLSDRRLRVGAPRKKQSAKIQPVEI